VILENPAYDPAAVPRPADVAGAFHASLPGYAPTPVHDLGFALLKDESSRLGLPAFKSLGASWATECAMRPGLRTLVAASAGNHGRAVAHEAARRGLACRIFLPERSVAARRDAIAAEGAEIVVGGTYEEALARAAAAGAEPDAAEIADAGDSQPAHDVIDGYATLFAEAAAQAQFDVLVVPVGVGSLAAAAARFAAGAGVEVIGVEPETAACLTASLAAGRPTSVPTPGTSMAGLDCAEVSAAAWPTLRAGIRGTITVSDAEAHAAMRELAAAGLAIGDCGAASLAALRKAGLGGRVLLLATEGVTDPQSYGNTVG
jgi:diaminopropionate ammonia-lyase